MPSPARPGSRGCVGIPVATRNPDPAAGFLDPCRASERLVVVFLGRGHGAMVLLLNLLPEDLFLLLSQEPERGFHRKSSLRNIVCRLDTVVVRFAEFDQPFDRVPEHP